MGHHSSAWRGAQAARRRDPARFGGGRSYGYRNPFAGVNWGAELVGGLMIALVVTGVGFVALLLLVRFGQWLGRGANLMVFHDGMIVFIAIPASLLVLSLLWEEYHPVVGALGFALTWAAFLFLLWTGHVPQHRTIDTYTGNHQQGRVTTIAKGRAVGHDNTDWGAADCERFRYLFQGGGDSYWLEGCYESTRVHPFGG